MSIFDEAIFCLSFSSAITTRFWNLSQRPWQQVSCTAIVNVERSAIFCILIPCPTPSPSSFHCLSWYLLLTRHRRPLWSWHVWCGCPHSNNHHPSWCHSCKTIHTITMMLRNCLCMWETFAFSNEIVPSRFPWTHNPQLLLVALWCIMPLSSACTCNMPLSSAFTCITCPLTCMHMLTGSPSSPRRQASHPDCNAHTRAWHCAGCGEHERTRRRDLCHVSTNWWVTLLDGSLFCLFCVCSLMRNSSYLFFPSHQPMAVILNSLILSSFLFPLCLARLFPIRIRTRTQSHVCVPRLGRSCLPLPFNTLHKGRLFLAFLWLLHILCVCIVSRFLPFKTSPCWFSTVLLMMTLT